MDITRWCKLTLMWGVIRVVLLIAFIFIVIMDIAELILSKIYSDCNLGFICLLRFYNKLSAELMEIESASTMIYTERKREEGR